MKYTDDQQYGLVLRKSPTGVMFALRMLMKKNREGQN